MEVVEHLLKWGSVLRWSKFFKIRGCGGGRGREALGVLADTAQRCEECFSQPKTLVNDLHINGFKAIWMLDPGIKQEEGYFAYDSGYVNDVWVQKEDGQHFVGGVWPGPCVFPDYTQEKTCLWWANLVKD